MATLGYFNQAAQAHLLCLLENSSQKGLYLEHLEML